MYIMRTILERQRVLQKDSMMKLNQIVSNWSPALNIFLHVNIAQFGSKTVQRREVSRENRLYSVQAG